MKLIYSVALASLLMAGCKGHDPNTYTITGEIEGLPDSTVVVLQPIAHKSLDPIAEAVVINGKFEFKGAAEEPRAVSLLVKDNYGYKHFMLENAEISLKGSVSAKEAYDGKTQFSFDDVAVSGSPLTEKLNQLMLPRTNHEKKHFETQDKFASVSEALMKARQNRDKEALDSICATEEYAAMEAEEHRFFSGLDSIFDEAVKNNRESFWAPLLMIVQTSYLTAEQRDDYESLSDEAKNSYYGQLVYEEIYPVGRPGDAMPKFNGKDIKGNDISLATACEGKKYLLLDFWASWCGPCRREIPNLKEIYKKHGANGFDILSISIDQEEEPWLKAVKDEALEWNNLRDADHSIADLYHVSAVPTMYLVDSEGKLVAENLRGEELAKKIDELMSK